MNKWIVVGILVVLGIVFAANYQDNPVQELEIKEICFEENCFNVEIADSKEERALGLMNREKLCEDCGMLFVYPEEGDYKFWMKNTLIPLDIIWMDSNYNVLHIAEAVPCVTEQCELYGPSEDSIYILEINSGKSNEIGLTENSELELVYS